MKQPESISKKVKETGNKSRHQMQNSGIQLKRREIPWMTTMGSPGQELCSCSEDSPENKRMQLLDGISYLMDMSLAKLRKLVMEREGWHAAVHAKSQT